METLSELREKITVEWPAQHPDLPFVWNTEWNRFFADGGALGRVKVILCADNPGVEEHKHSIYLAPTGRSGREARRTLAAAGYDWATEVLCINKVPVHTPKTNDLRALVDRASLAAMERVMADGLVRLVRETGAWAWIVGMGGCDAREAGWPHPLRGAPDRFPASYILPHYFAALKAQAEPEVAGRIFMSKHFSHGHFGVEIKEPLAATGGDLAGALAMLPHARNLFS
jgi:hypothetical protein